MFGIHGLDPFGLVHALLGVAALILGLAVLLRRKGTRVHRRIGQGYVLSMVLLNATALMIYDLYGRFGPFHVAAVISMVTVCAGFVPVYLRRPQATWMQLHATFMCWSYVGLLAAFVSEIAVRVPGIGFGTAVVAATAVVVAGGAILIHTRVPRILAKFRTGGLTGTALGPLKAKADSTRQALPPRVSAQTAHLLPVCGWRRLRC